MEGEKVMKVIKRDGTKVPFDKSKIVTAINKALEEVAEEYGLEIEY